MKCSLCKSNGVTKLTCPLNPTAKNKNYKLHRVKSRSYQPINNPQFVLPKCGVNVFANFDGICWFNAVIVALFFCDAGREYLWPITFEFKNKAGLEGMIPRQLRKDFAPFSKLNNITLLLYLIMVNIQISLKSMKYHGPFDPDETVHELVKIQEPWKLSQCSAMANLIACSISMTTGWEYCDDIDSGGNTMYFLTAMHNYYNECFRYGISDSSTKNLEDHADSLRNMDYIWDKNIRLTKYSAFIIRLETEEYSHAVSCFQCNNKWYYYDNNIYMYLTINTEGQASFNDLAPVLNLIIPLYHGEDIIYNTVVGINFDYNISLPNKIYITNKPLNYINSLNVKGLGRLINFLNDIPDENVDELLSYMSRTLNLNFENTVIFKFLEPHIQKAVKANAERYRPGY